MSESRRTKAVAARVPPTVRTILAEHAAETGRTLSAELRLWAEFAAATTVFTRLSAPGIESSPDVEQARHDSREDMSRYLAELLPHEVWLPLDAEPLLPIPSMN
jgi:hypothetical protein